MSDGGKGSSPRPYSVSKEEFNNNFDNIFRKKHKEIVDAAKDCGCYACMEKKIDPHTMLPATMTTFIVCPICGNKRCPHATDHRFICTNSNESGQEGSRY